MIKIGDKVYTLNKEQKQDTITCPACEGRGFVVVNGYEVKCPKNRREKYAHYTVGEPFIVQMIIETSSELLYSPDSLTKREINETYDASVTEAYSQDEIFVSVGEAQNECDKLNRR